jgi:GNAT superfamily N-acetyltransferase
VSADIVVREAKPGDLAALLGLYVQLSSENAGTQPRNVAGPLRAILANRGMRLLVAELGGSVVGTVTLALVPNLTHGGRPWAQVENMVVEEDRRGTGVGRRLIEECLRIGHEAGCYKVQLQSGNQRREGRHDAHAFYAHLGFQPSSVGFRYYVD